MDLTEFESRYAPREPRRAADNQDQLRLLSQEEGVAVLDTPPAASEERHVPGDASAIDRGRHLWTFFQSEVPYVLETAPHANPALKSGVAKHTNLTGGAPASCGRELWIDPADDGKLYVNGASGRYGPTTPAQLQDAVAVFRHLGFVVTSFGWDHDTDLPARVLRP